MYSGLPLETILATDITPEVAAIATRDYWPIERELLATIVEMLDALIRITAKAGGAKGVSSEGIKIPRPYDRRRGHSDVPKDEPLAAGAFSRQLMMGGGF